jgi:hypothetical protein
MAIELTSEEKILLNFCIEYGIKFLIEYIHYEENKFKIQDISIEKDGNVIPLPEISFMTKLKEERKKINNLFRLRGKINAG